MDLSPSRTSTQALTIAHTPAQVAQWLASHPGKTLGFIPTMGALHRGHLSLVRRSKMENELTVVSVFVNPTQFNNAEDLAKYPITTEADTALLQAEEVDLLFLPQAEAMYPSQPLIQLSFGSLEAVMEGAHRPGHFHGVALIVSKLLHVVPARRAYFGLKDLQQFTIVQALVRDLGFPVEIVGCPTVREADGLAMSSRNMRLSPQARQQALAVLQALDKALELLSTHPMNEALTQARAWLAAQEGVEQVEYLELAELVQLSRPSQLDMGEEYALCVAAWVGGVRLIDNQIFTWI